MILFPAIDIKNNQCVRLCQGDFERLKVYGKDPVLMAKTWKERGAEFLHLVDLDGAKDEKLINQDSIEKIIKTIGLHVQVGGGIRSKKRVEKLLALGIERVIVGTIAVENKKLLKELVDEYKERIVVSIDARNGKVALRGWKVISEVSSIELCKELEQIGVKTIVYTDISKDGMMMGPNFHIYEALSKEVNLNIIASGGISSIKDIYRLKNMNIYGAIIGKALYDEKIDLKEAYRCLQEE
ncbi:1-(5-phosphoribosyl)-5-[(5-phosphoribosylamino)methylideneamino]imidazole-4-carboxamide isomerase [Haloimpatiens sp. FM7330]|uniref:1-(5-phosphoribosyl)-5-[(5- phosphoribosylamino)methylideneamino]imidazole-4- carboxamide isomerase n=1 Tax=Haloimpatiens sp. FM7330 TaxID=3298610 RepID=UPI00362F256F